MKKRILVVLLALGMLSGCTPTGQAKEGNHSSGQTSGGGTSSAPVVKTEYEPATLCLPNETVDGQIDKVVQIEKTDEPIVELVQALVVEGALPDGTEVQKWSLEGEAPQVLTVDLNAAFAEKIAQTGTAGETMILGSLINTLFAYFGTNDVEIHLTADGTPVETGHNIYSEPFTALYLFD